MSELPLPRTLQRLPIMAGMALLHLGCYLGVTRLNAGRDPATLHNLATPLDHAIPHIAATWPLYWLTYPFVLLGTGAALWHADQQQWRRGCAALVAVTLLGGVIQLLIPAMAPWPAYPAPLQAWYHTSGVVLPYANLPSMHVTYSMMTAGLLTRVISLRPVRWIAWPTSIAITLSTVTLKEHFVADAVAGAALALGALWWWRLPAQPARVR